MPKKMLIDATHAEETRVVVVEGNKVDEFDFESLNKRQLSGNIYLAKVTRVEPSLQAAFVDYGGNRHGFLSFAEIHPDYYQIPVADREALIAEEEAYAKSLEEEASIAQQKKSRVRKRKTKVIAEEANNDEILTSKIIDNSNTNTSIEEQTAETSAEINSDLTEDIDESNINNDKSLDIHTDEDIEANTEDARAEDDIIDDGIESVANEDIEEEVRPRKPRPRRYKIQEVIKVRQILLIQVVKEERGNKGAALTTYLSLAGRYCVLMPNTARGGGISRKITNVQDRKKIKEITSELDVPKGAGLIVRTAGAKRNRDDILRDYEYLMRQWTQIRDVTLESIAPTQIYAEGDIIKRSIRDLYNNDIDEIIVDGERGFEAAKAYMTMLMPSHVKRVKQYKNKMPLYARYQVESYLGGMFNPTVQLKSGGYIVIGVTEALVAVDVNSGKATKESSIEKTALKTNLEAADEVARQLRLRDLAGLIVIDFIDMEERRNNISVEKRMKDKLKSDRARIQVGRISGFGLMEMSRQRLRPGMLEATTKECPHCLGTGLVRSDDSQALSILREIEEEAIRKRTKEIHATVPVGISNYLLNHKRENIALIESQYGISIIIEASSTMIGTEYELEKRKTSSRIIADVFDMPTALEMETAANIEVVKNSEDDISLNNPEEDDKPKKRRRRRRRKPRNDETLQDKTVDTETNIQTDDTKSIQENNKDTVQNTEELNQPVVTKSKRKPRIKKSTEVEITPEDITTEDNIVMEVKPTKRKRRTKAQIEADKLQEDKSKIDTSNAKEDETIIEEKPKRARVKTKKIAKDVKPTTVEKTDNKDKKLSKIKKVEENTTLDIKEEPPTKPKRKGWWSKS
ncbi:Rne/Rng family ribonuclease [Amylibacter sp.]|jgi:ribonuclease E|nr:Rne/Rng family ribonuclease [Amylibacter sp.]MDB2320641.1 Rne/Rng family ribonuclease [Amylibacter sp.]MDC0108892.1 Rne/Rng family ribonuclease [Amylibacter sp.]MDC1242590.1 Rne/Rng family ribonuclease [Amylibacter sp.]|tara:strand:+ start:7013 stop:9589 length:2577 start_codon:yes stop_codon:yes gene_type:complete